MFDAFYKSVSSSAFFSPKRHWIFVFKFIDTLRSRRVETSSWWSSSSKRRHDRSDPQRPPREENTREVQRGRYHRRLEKARRGADRDEAGENTVRLSLSLFRRSGGRKKRPVDTASPTFLRTDDASNIFSLSLKRRRRRRRRKGFKSGTRYTRTTSRSTITR